ncbi:hypothetical protein CEP54_014018 [Fusarium duplospermum]|uniref:Uncharacterized protein n=1 Tax=Fusarium duplospermum TaxID=1325734 RepID=A0A428NZA6_9HYPO|nr:hypothetical protein CEP54_014018 [Fusarium duplospermum]
MPKAQKTPWPGYWEPTPRNPVRNHEHELAFVRSRRVASILPYVEDGQQRGQKRGADFADEDSEGEIFHTPKARCMTVDEEADKAMRSVSTLDSGDGDESQPSSESPATQHLSVEERLATMEDKMQSLDETTRKHVGDIGYLRPRTAGLASEGRLVKKRVNVLEEMVVKVNDNVSGLSEAHETSCTGVNRDIMALYQRLHDLREKTKKDLKMAREVLEEMRAAQAEDRATISSLRKELSEMRDKGSTTTESPST